jgi:hypothetical protein
MTYLFLSLNKPKSIILIKFNNKTELYVKILWPVDPLLTNDREMRNYTTAIAKQWPVKSNR